MSFQYIFLKIGVKISKYNRSCKYKHIYCHYIDIYLCLFAFKSPRRTVFRFEVLHFLPKSLRNGGDGGGGEFVAKLIYRYEV